jgi:hypothetical protein
MNGVGGTLLERTAREQIPRIFPDLTRLVRESFRFETSPTVFGEGAKRP